MSQFIAFTLFNYILLIIITLSEEKINIYKTYIHRKLKLNFNSYIIFIAEKYDNQQKCLSIIRLHWDMKEVERK